MHNLYLEMIYFEMQLLKKASANQISRTASPVEQFSHALQQVSFHGTSYVMLTVCIKFSILC
jgi:hypothetical protein